MISLAAILFAASACVKFRESQRSRSRGRVVIGNPLAPGVSLVIGSKTPDTYRDPNTPLAGPAGLADDVQKGLLREATAADAQAWANALATQPSNADLPPVAGMGRPTPKAPELYNAYVVLKPMVIPAGLYGAHAATFFVPKGTPAPPATWGIRRSTTSTR